MDKEREDRRGKREEEKRGKKEERRKTWSVEGRGER
jgi:hypothetical protein